MTSPNDFTSIVHLMRRDLGTAFPVLGRDDITAIIANAAWESGRFKQLQEVSPLVKGSAGGYGFMQWTGPRRRAFMAWCEHEELAPSSYSANVGFAIYELKTSERGALGKLRSAKGLDAKVHAFERAFLRAGIPHTEKRQALARQIAAMPDLSSKKPMPAELEALVPKPPPTATTSTTNKAAAGIGVLALLSAMGDTIKEAAEALRPVLDLMPVSPVWIGSGLTMALAAYIIRERLRHMRENGT